LSYKAVGSPYKAVGLLEIPDLSPSLWEGDKGEGS
jgi:hypothetical protein